MKYDQILLYHPSLLMQTCRLWWHWELTLRNHTLIWNPCDSKVHSIYWTAVPEWLVSLVKAKWSWTLRACSKHWMKALWVSTGVLGTIELDRSTALKIFYTSWSEEPLTMEEVYSSKDWQCCNIISSNLSDYYKCMRNLRLTLGLSLMY